MLFENSKWAEDIQFRTSALVRSARFLASQDMEHSAYVMTRECGIPYKYNLPHMLVFQ